MCAVRDVRGSQNQRCVRLRLCGLNDSEMCEVRVCVGFRESEIVRLGMCSNGCAEA